MLAGLTKKQIRVLKLTGDGLCEKEIAHEMNISVKTVEDHRYRLRRIFPALDCPVKLARLAIAFGLSTLCLVCMAAAAQPILVVSNPPPVVQLAWSPPAAGNVSSYNVYYGVGSRQYTNVTHLGNVTNATITLPARGVAFFFAVTDVAAGLESDFSNEVNYTAPSPLPPPTQKPLTVITVLKSSTSSGVFADTGMNWSDTPDQPQAFYKLKIDKGIALATTPPALPTK